MQERLEFLFGEGFDANAYDLNNSEVLALLLERTFGLVPNPVQLSSREILARQIIEDDPPELWPTVQRLLTSGLDRGLVFEQLSLTLGRVMMDARVSDDSYDAANYVAALAYLPHPLHDEIEQTLITLVRSHQGIGIEDLIFRCLEELERHSEDRDTTYLVERTFDDLEVELGPLSVMVDDRLVHVEGLTAGMVLTHCLSDAERSTGWFNAAFDLAGFCRRDDLALSDGRALDVFSVERGGLGWMGPSGWLEQFPAGSILSVQVDAIGVVRIEHLLEEPAPDPRLVARLRAIYDRNVAELELPVRAEDLVLGLLLEEETTFGEPTATLRTLSEAAGLEWRMDQVAHTEVVWNNERLFRRDGRLLDLCGNDAGIAKKASQVLAVADRTARIDGSMMGNEEIPQGSTFRSALDDLEDEVVLWAVAVELFEGEFAGDEDLPETFIDGLVGAASRSAHVASARLLASVLSERKLEPFVAEQQLVLAHEADPNRGSAIDRLAWYSSVRGDARRAAQLWRSLEPTNEISRDLWTVEEFASTPRRALGRNMPCWCGSGRKYKVCHLDVPELAPLPERVGWLCRKAVGFMKRHGSVARSEIFEIAAARAVDPDDPDSIAEAFDDPIVIDLALTEGGWFGQFLENFGALLPPDEALLAESWQYVQRSVHEILEVRAGRGVTLRDLRTSDRVEVRERTFSAQARKGALVCARAVHDGETHQFIGGIFPVSPGQEAELLDLLDVGDPMDIAQWVSALHRPPTLATREGEPMVECELVIGVSDPTAVRAHLDQYYEVGGPDDADSWVETFPLNEDERILRARLHLVGDILTVSTTSEARADRVLAALETASLETTVLSDHRTPVDMRSMLRRAEIERELGRLAGRTAPTRRSLSPDEVEQIGEVREQFEKRWCDESIPALGGITPRQAADDPSRRESLIRLIASFEDYGDPSDSITMRPKRLRELLGL